MCGLPLQFLLSDIRKAIPGFVRGCCTHSSSERQLSLLQNNKLELKLGTQPSLPHQYKQFSNAITVDLPLDPSELDRPDGYPHNLK